MKWIVDRIEDGIATVETDDMSVITVPLSKLPEGVREGDVVTLSLDKDEKKRIEDNVNSLMDELFE